MIWHTHVVLRIVLGAVLHELRSIHFSLLIQIFTIVLYVSWYKNDTVYNVLLLLW